MITSSSVTSEKAAAGAAEVATPKKTESVKKSARAGAEDNAAVKVEISEEGRALAKRKAGRKEKEAVEAAKTREEKEDDLVTFYAKRLVKATKELDKEDEAAAKKEAEEALLEASETLKTPKDTPSASKLPAP